MSAPDQPSPTDASTESSPGLAATSSLPSFIGQLTGVRFVAAAWVLLYHLQAPLDRAGLLLPGIAEVARVGRLGVDLFFALSGFILTHTYLTRMGPKATGQGSKRFLTLRLARIYPVHFVMLNVAGLAAIVAGASDRSWLNPIDYLKNVFLVQEWGPSPQRGWNYVAWSLSMEWLAYLLFPLLVLVLWRWHRTLATRWLAVAWLVVLVPLLAYGTTRDDVYYQDNWGSTIRVLTEFTAGGIAYLIALRFVNADGEPRQRVERLATTLSVALPVLVVVGSIALARIDSLQPSPDGRPADAEPLPPYLHLWLVPLVIAWIGALALSRRGVARLLGTNLLLLGGYISFSLYMTHIVVFALWRRAIDIVGLTGGIVYALAVAVLVAACLAAAWAMWRYIEEPAREWIRVRTGARRTPVGEPGAAG